MIKIYEYNKDGEIGKTIDFNYETELGKKGSELLNSLTESHTAIREETTEFDIAFYDEWEPDESLYLTSRGKSKLEKFFEENIYNILPKDLQLKCAAKNEMGYSVNTDAYDLIEITVYYREDHVGHNICTICYEVIVK